MVPKGSTPAAEDLGRPKVYQQSGNKSGHAGKRCADTACRLLSGRQICGRGQALRHRLMNASGSRCLAGDRSLQRPCGIATRTLDRGIDLSAIGLIVGHLGQADVREFRGAMHRSRLQRRGQVRDERLLLRSTSRVGMSDSLTAICSLVGGPTGLDAMVFKHAAKSGCPRLSSVRLHEFGVRQIERARPKPISHPRFCSNTTAYADPA